MSRNFTVHGLFGTFARNSAQKPLTELLIWKPAISDTTDMTNAAIVMKSHNENLKV